MARARFSHVEAKKNKTEFSYWGGGGLIYLFHNLTLLPAYNICPILIFKSIFIVLVLLFTGVSFPLPCEFNKKNLARIISFLFFVSIQKVLELGC